jgi:hypothetical protein
MIKAKKSSCGSCGKPFDPRAEGGIEMSPIGEDAVSEADDGKIVASKRGKKRRSEATNGNGNGNGHGSEESEASAGEGESEDEDEVARQGKERGRASRRLASQVPVSQVEDSQAEEDSQEYESEWYGQSFFM